jgi:hypothetical protein
MYPPEQNLTIMVSYVRESEMKFRVHVAELTTVHALELQLGKEKKVKQIVRNGVGLLFGDETILQNNDVVLF